MNIRKPLRDAAVTALADATFGFNAKLAAELAAASVIGHGFTIDFGANSANFLQSYYTSAGEVDLSAIRSWPAMVAYTTQYQPTQVEKFRQISGTLLLNVDVYLRFAFRDVGGSAYAMEGNNTEDVADAVEGAVLEVFQRRALTWPSGYTYTGNITPTREPVAQMADGYMQRLAFQLEFEVNR